MFYLQSDAKESLLNLEDKNNKNEKESDTTGSIPWKVYYDYFNSGLHIIFYAVLAIAVVGSHALFILLDWWLAQW